MSIRNLIVSIAIACLMGCGAYRSERPPTYGFMVGHDFVGRSGPRSDACEVVAAKGHARLPLKPKPDLIWFGSTFEGGRAKPGEAKAFGDSIGATRCEYYESQLEYCGTGMTRSQMRALQPAYVTEYHFFGPPTTPIVRGFPPDWAFRYQGGTRPRGSVDARWPVEIREFRSDLERPEPVSNVTADRIGDLAWRASDEAFRERLIDFARYQGAEILLILTEKPRDSNSETIDPDPPTARVYFFRYRGPITGRPR